MLTPDQLTTIRAALSFWRDEIVPAGNAVAAHYYDSPVDRDLSAREVESLIHCFQPSQVSNGSFISNNSLSLTPSDPKPTDGPARLGTLVFGPDQDFGP